MTANLVGAVVPYKIDRDNDQVIRHIIIQNCSLTDDNVRLMMKYLMENNQVSLTFLDLSDNKLTHTCAESICSFLMNHNVSKDFEHLILDGNQLKDLGLMEISNALMQRKSLLNNYLNQDHIQDQTVMPLLSFSMSNIGATDQGFYNFLKKMEAIHNDNTQY